MAGVSLFGLVVLNDTLKFAMIYDEWFIVTGFLYVFTPIFC